MKALNAVLLILALLPGAVLADDNEKGGKGAGGEKSEKGGREERGSTLLPSQANPTWAQECSACHIAYAPGLLPAASWRKVMAGLDQHFGADASLTAPENQAVSAFLVANASNRWTGTGAPLRITETPWFKRKHNSKEVPAAVWQRAAVKSPANCQACHAGADKADFNEHAVKIPQ
jgi:hypothetical protein